MHVESNGIYTTTSQDKWDKGRAYIEELQSAYTTSDCPCYDHKTLERMRGCLVHLQWVYPAITPFLKGLHLTIDSWRPGRNDEGWKVDLHADWEVAEDDLRSAATNRAPVQVQAVPRLAQDVKSLATLFQSPTPPRQSI